MYPCAGRHVLRRKNARLLLSQHVSAAGQRQHSALHFAKDTSSLERSQLHLDRKAVNGTLEHKSSKKVCHPFVCLLLSNPIIPHHVKIKSRDTAYDTYLKQHTWRSRCHGTGKPSKTVWLYSTVPGTSCKVSQTCHGGTVT